VSESQPPAADGAQAAEEAQAEAEVREVLDSGASVAVETLDYADIERSRRQQNIVLQKWYAFAILVGLGFQLLIVDLALFLYAAIGVHWKVDPNVFYVWLSATIVEVIGVVLVVTRHLFPTAAQERAGA
jgi:hypothetical protein